MYLVKWGRLIPLVLLEVEDDPPKVNAWVGGWWWGVPILSIPGYLVSYRNVDNRA